MLYTLQNEFLTVQVSDRGAELQSIRTADGTEQLWQGDPNLWPDRAPLLFPLVARLKNETYTLDGVPYHIPIHGFAMTSTFTLVEQDAQSLTLALSDSEETRAQYPFAFRLLVRLTLDGCRLTKTFTVENHSDRAMLYELGGHEGYRVALAEGEVMADSYVLFEGVDALHPLCSDENLYLLEETRTIPLENHRLYLKPGLFALDALILDDLPTRRMTLASDKNSRRITVDFADFPFAGVWSWNAPAPNYVCLEPWSSLPDYRDLDTELANKRGVRTLAPGANETLSYTITITL